MVTGFPHNYTLKQCGFKQHVYLESISFILCWFLVVPIDEITAWYTAKAECTLPPIAPIPKGFPVVLYNSQSNTTEYTFSSMSLVSDVLNTIMHQYKPTSTLSNYCLVKTIQPNLPLPLSNTLSSLHISSGTSVKSMLSSTCWILLFTYSTKLEINSPHRSQYNRSIISGCRALCYSRGYDIQFYFLSLPIQANRHHFRRSKALPSIQSRLL